MSTAMLQAVKLPVLTPDQVYLSELPVRSNSTPNVLFLVLDKVNTHFGWNIGVDELSKKLAEVEAILAEVVAILGGDAVTA